MTDAGTVPAGRSPAAVWSALEAWCRARDYHGWDPFDGLESRLFQRLPGSGIGPVRLIWQQIFKRLPLNPRVPARVPQTLNPVSLALFSRGYGAMGRIGEQRGLGERLLSAWAREWDGPGQGWSYPFDWQARAFAVGKGTPNVIATAYAVRTLTLADADTGLDVGDAIHRAAEFVAGALVRRRGRHLYLGYVPNSDAMVHNANLWAAYILAEAVRRGGRPAWRELALDAIGYSLAAQAPDGSWRYGEAGHHGFIDSFHTGYILEALHLCGRLLGSEEWAEPVRRGLHFYEETFFTAQGQPKYYHDRLWPADPTCCAQAMITLLEIDPTPARRALAGRILDWTLTHLWLPERGHFAYQAHGRWMNGIPYMRWTQAWMFLGLALWLKNTGEGG